MSSSQEFSSSIFSKLNLLQSLVTGVSNPPPSTKSTPTTFQCSLQASCQVLMLTEIEEKQVRKLHLQFHTITDWPDLILKYYFWK
jgi:hypothetical protein